MLFLKQLFPRLLNEEEKKILKKEKEKETAIS